MRNARTILCLTALALVLCGASSAQTFTGTVLSSTDELYQVLPPGDGQYDFTLTWEQDGLDVLGLILLCDGENHGISAGNREAVARLSVGLDGAAVCVLAVTQVEGLISDYTVNVAGTEGPVFIDRLTFEEAPLKSAMLVTELSDGLRALATAAAEEVAAERLAGSPTRKAGETVTYLEQIFAGNPKDFILDIAEDGFLSMTAMWNRANASIRVEGFCEAGGSELDIGYSESGQERFTRFDADVFTGTTCTITVSTDKTAAMAFNIAYLTDGDTTFIP